MTTLTKIENTATRLLEFPGQKYVTVEITKQELDDLKKDIEEEYEDVDLSPVDWDRVYWKMELNGILFTLKIK